MLRLAKTVSFAGLLVAVALMLSSSTAEAKGHGGHGHAGHGHHGHHGNTHHHHHKSRHHGHHHHHGHFNSFGAFIDGDAAGDADLDAGDDVATDAVAVEPVSYETSIDQPTDDAVVVADGGIDLSFHNHHRHPRHHGHHGHHGHHAGHAGHHGGHHH